MKCMRIAGLALLVFVGLTAAPQLARAGVRLGIGVGFGFPIYAPGWGQWYPYYSYSPVYYYPPPPVYVQPAPVAQSVCQAPPPPVAQSTPPPPVLPTGLTQASAGSTADVERHLQMLSDPDERTRATAAIQLGRLKAERAIDPLAATLAGDRSANVREFAARALGIIASAKGLPALRNAALNDSDRDVRHSAEFAVEIVQAAK